MIRIWTPLKVKIPPPVAGDIDGPVEEGSGIPLGEFGYDDPVRGDNYPSPRLLEEEAWWEKYERKLWKKGKRLPASRASLCSSVGEVGDGTLIRGYPKDEEPFWRGLYEWEDTDPPF